MRRRKQDAADLLVNDILAAVRRYKATKDAPDKPVQLGFIHEDQHVVPVGPWVCRHLTHCSHRGECQSKLTIGSDKFPLKTVKAAS